MLGGVVAWQGLVANTDDLVVSIGHVEVFPTGIAFRVTMLLRDARRNPHRGYGLVFEEPDDPGAGLRIGALFPDGRRTSEFHEIDWDDTVDPDHPVLWPQGGGGGDREWRSDYWLWPAPNQGDLILVVQWLAQGVPETRVTIPGGLLTDARTRILEVWPPDTPDDGPP